MALLKTSILLLLTCFVLLFAYLVVDSVIQYRKLRQFKGPWLACFSPLWLFKCTADGRMYLAIADALQEYGKTTHILR